MRYDKYAAKTNKSRIAEKKLIGLSVLCGSVGVLLGMYMFSTHKTNKLKFSLGVPLILVAQIAFFVYVVYINK